MRKMYADQERKLKIGGVALKWDAETEVPKETHKLLNAKTLVLTSAREVSMEPERFDHHTTRNLLFQD